VQYRAALTSLAWRVLMTGVAALELAKVHRAHPQRNVTLAVTGGGDEPVIGPQAHEVVRNGLGRGGVERLVLVKRRRIGLVALRRARHRHGGREIAGRVKGPRILEPARQPALAVFVSGEEQRRRLALDALGDA